MHDNVTVTSGGDGSQRQVSVLKSMLTPFKSRHIHLGPYLLMAFADMTCLNYQILTSVRFN